MKDTRIQLLNEEIKAADHLLNHSWNNAYREAFLHGKLYAYKKILDTEKRREYTQEDARDSGQ